MRITKEQGQRALLELQSWEDANLQGMRLVDALDAMGWCHTDGSYFSENRFGEWDRDEVQTALAMIAAIAEVSP